MKLLFLFCAILLFCLSQLARACDKNVSRITKDSPSPCTAWVVSDEQMQEFAKSADKLELNKKEKEIDLQMLRLSEREVEYYRQKSDITRKELLKADNKRFWTNLAHFSLGVVLTGIAAKAAIESTK